jgi:hypothetical protein
MSNKPNPELELAFRQWLAQQDMQIREIISLEQPSHTSAFTIRYGTIELKGSIEDRGIDVFAERNGECWDILLSLVVVPAAVVGGYHCLGCVQNERRVFADMNTLWRNHLFGPLLGWIRRRLIPANRLCFYSAPLARWVRLVKEGDDLKDVDSLLPP